jgi:hypothetical protein
MAFLRGSVVDWLQVLGVLWPIAVIVIPIVLTTGFLWLKTQLATKAELKTVEGELEARINDHSGRFERGSTKFADHDKRIALVEEECKSVPSRQDLQFNLSEVSQRLRGVEVGNDFIKRELSTANDYLKIIVDKGFKS